MKSTALIDFSYVYSFSVRSIGSYLKNKGHKVSVVHYTGENGDVLSLLSDKSLKLLSDFCKKYNAIGISILCTHHLKRAIQINDYLKDKIKSKIIWGGIPVICDPYFYLKYTDYICAGEGETIMADFLETDDPTDISGLGYKSKDGRFVINDVPPLLDLNKIPIPYFDLEDTFVLKNDKIISLEEDPGPLFTQSAKHGYRIFPIRGCPYSCTFCSNDKIKGVFRGKGPILRSTEPSRIIAELEKAKELIPNLERISFYEDDFMSRTDDELRGLLVAYSQKIGLPIKINTSINNLTESKINLVIESGVKLIQVKVGLQSGSVRVNREIFKRAFDREGFLQKVRSLASKRIPVALDVISDNPYETLDDKYESLLFYYDLFRNLRDMPVRDSYIAMLDHKLMFYPGTELYNKAVADGIIDEKYIDKVLLTRTTKRDITKDMDNDAFLLALFNWSVKKRNKTIANFIFRLLRLRPVFNVTYSLNIFKYLFPTARRIKNIFRSIKNRILHLEEIKADSEAIDL